MGPLCVLRGAHRTSLIGPVWLYAQRRGFPAAASRLSLTTDLAQERQSGSAEHEERHSSKVDSAYICELRITGPPEVETPPQVAGRRVTSVVSGNRVQPIRAWLEGVNDPESSEVLAPGDQIDLALGESLTVTHRLVQPPADCRSQSHGSERGDPRNPNWWTAELPERGANHYDDGDRVGQQLRPEDPGWAPSRAASHPLVVPGKQRGERVSARAEVEARTSARESQRQRTVATGNSPNRLRCPKRSVCAMAELVAGW